MRNRQKGKEIESERKIFLNNFCKVIIGMEFNKAIIEADHKKLILRITHLDGQKRMLSNDVNCARINVRVKDGIVQEANHEFYG